MVVMIIRCCKFEPINKEQQLSMISETFTFNSERDLLMIYLTDQEKERVSSMDTSHHFYAKSKQGTPVIMMEQVLAFKNDVMTYGEGI